MYFFNNLLYNKHIRLLGDLILKNKKHIYIVLTQTGTIISRLIKLYTKDPYNHVAITDDETLCQMYSFCRRYLRFPLPGGFVTESINKGIFKLYNNIPCEIYRFEVTDEQYSQYKLIINHFCKNSSFYTYNILGLLTIPLGIRFQRSKHFVCSQFVAYILQTCKIANFKEDISLIKPDNFRLIENATLEYSGNIHNFLTSFPTTA